MQPSPCPQASSPQPIEGAATLATVHLHRRRAMRFHDPSLTAMLVLQCLVMFVAGPLAALGYELAFAAIELLILAFVILVVAVSRSPIAALITVIGFGCSVVGTRLQIHHASVPSAMLSHVGGEVGIAVSGYIIARALYAPGPITLHRVIGAIVFYLNLGLFFAMTYRLIRDALPAGLSGIPTDAGDCRRSCRKSISAW
jgi:hypothetical protein